MPTSTLRFRFALLLLIASSLLRACTTREAAPLAKSPVIEHAAVELPADPPEAVSLRGWQGETFALPPDFAPGLPTGTETLLFAPGWRDPKSEEFWSYAFVMWINEPAPNATRIDDLLEQYYNGLMATFAASKQKDISTTPARVDVVRLSPNFYEARMHLIDAFATFEPIDVRILIESVAQTDARTALHIRVSPQPEGHAIWRSLTAAIADILSRAAAPHVQPNDTSPTSTQNNAR